MSDIKDIKILSSLEKLYDCDKLPTVEYKSFSMLKNEKKSFQIAVEAEKESEADLFFEGTVKNLRFYTVEHVRSDFPMFKKGADKYYRFSEADIIPICCYPLTAE